MKETQRNKSKLVYKKFKNDSICKQTCSQVRGKYETLEFVRNSKEALASREKGVISIEWRQERKKRKWNGRGGMFGLKKEKQHITSRNHENQCYQCHREKFY